MTAFNLKPIISVVDKVTGPMRAISRALGWVGKLVGKIGVGEVGAAIPLGIPPVTVPETGVEAVAAGIGKGGDFILPNAVSWAGADAPGRSKRLPDVAKGAVPNPIVAGFASVARGSPGSPPNMRRGWPPLSDSARGRPARLMALPTQSPQSPGGSCRPWSKIMGKGARHKGVR